MALSDQGALAVLQVAYEGHHGALGLGDDQPDRADVLGRRPAGLPVGVGGDVGQQLGAEATAFGRRAALPVGVAAAVFGSMVRV